MRVADRRPPIREKRQTHTKLTKKMVTRWEDLEIYDGLVYRRKKSPRAGKPDFMRLLLPLSQVEKALHQCHVGTLAGYFGIQKTMDQVRRRFYWATWKADTKRFFSNVQSVPVTTAENWPSKDPCSLYSPVLRMRDGTST